MVHLQEIDGFDNRTTSSQVYLYLLKAILTHKIPAGTRLVELKVSKELKVSITPVREAFSRLAIQGLLTVFAYKGTYVTVISKEYAEDVYFVRERLEKMAAEMAIEQTTKEDIEYITSLCREADKHYENNNIYESIQCDIAFHEFMIAKCGSDLLMEMWEMVKYRIQNIQSYTKITMRPCMEERHEKIIKAIGEKDCKAYYEAIEEHLHSSNSTTEFLAKNEIEYH